MVARGRLLGLLTSLCAVLSCGSAQASPLAPVVSVEPPSGIATGEATLRGQVNPGEQATTYQFQYGTTTAYGNSAPVTPASAGSGGLSVTISQHLSGLQPGTKYHFRLVATNATGTTEGGDATFATYPPAVQSGGCPNEERRAEQGATRLPDCRAYEMVSPLDKNGSNVLAVNGPQVGSSLNGDRVAFPLSAGAGQTTGSGAAGYFEYVSSRQEGVGWKSHGITPTPSPDVLQVFTGATFEFEFSSDFERSLVYGYDFPEPTNDIPKAENYYVEDTETGALQTVTMPLGSGPFNLFTVQSAARGSSSDLGVVTFEARANFLPEATGTRPKLYAWEHGTLKLAGVLPDGTLPVGGSHAPVPSSEPLVADRDAVSREGAEVLFTAEPTAGGNEQLYMRKNASSTVWVSEPKMAGATTEPQNVRFGAMTPDGQKVLFSTDDRLLADDPGGSGEALYMYTDSASPGTEANLAFIARIGEGGVTAMSEDGRRFYFFTHGTPEFPEYGTYLWDEGKVHFVAHTEQLLGPRSNEGFAEISSDGRQLSFVANESLDGANIGKPEGGFPFRTMYVYDEPTESLTCASCLPTGATTTSDTEVEPEAASYVVAYFKSGIDLKYLSSNGQFVFFTTRDPLVASDVNGLQDAYEYDVRTRTLSLLSSGVGESGTWFAAADREGNNVFMASETPLLAEDTDTLTDLYDARVDGGFPQPAVQTGGCVGDECQGTPSPAPSFTTASGFSGLGNIVFAKPGQSSQRSGTSAARAKQLRRAQRLCQKKPKARRKRCLASARARYGRHQGGKATKQTGR